jgi:hypothetical protein
MCNNRESGVFCGGAPRLCNEDLKQLELEVELSFGVGISSRELRQEELRKDK